MLVKRVFIDRGHGLNNLRHGQYDPGATSGGFQESKVVSTVAGDVVYYFKDDTRTHVTLTPEIGIGQLIDYLNAQYVPGDVLLALHMNAGHGSGTEVVYPANAAGDNRRNQALTIATILSMRLGIKNRGAVKDTDTPNGKKYDGLPLLRDTRCPAFILELGFIDSKKDVERVRAKGASSVALVINSLRGDA